MILRGKQWSLRPLPRSSRASAYSNRRRVSGEMSRRGTVGVWTAGGALRPIVEPDEDADHDEEDGARRDEGAGVVADGGAVRDLERQPATQGTPVVLVVHQKHIGGIRRGTSSVPGRLRRGVDDAAMRCARRITVDGSGEPEGRKGLRRASVMFNIGRVNFFVR